MKKPITILIIILAVLAVIVPVATARRSEGVTIRVFTNAHKLYITDEAGARLNEFNVSQTESSTTAVVIVSRPTE